MMQVHEVINFHVDVYANVDKQRYPVH